MCLVACNGQLAHTHQYGEWSTTKNATCTVDGERVRYCDCGEKQSDTIASIGHNYVDGKCTNCGKIEGTPDCQHTNLEVLPAKAPTQTEEGLTEGKKCADCGEVIVAQTTISKLIGSYGLKYALNDDDVSYCVVGRGECNDWKIIIPDSYNGLPVTKIDDEAFKSEYMFDSIVIPDSVTSIGESAFYSSYLKSITFGSGVNSIGDYAFANCDNLMSIEVPHGVTSIGYRTFYGCDNLTSVGPVGSGADVEIPNSVTSIGDDAFSKCPLKRVELPDGVTNIGAKAFKDCTKITRVIIPDSVTSIGEEVFSGCDDLTNVTIGDGVTSIGEYAFYNCDSLTSIVIPDRVTSIGDYAFYDCSSLTSVVIGDSVTSIGEYAFDWCDSLTSIVVHDSVTSIGHGAFLRCYSLTDVYYTGSSEDAQKITIDSGNDVLATATIHYNYVPEN